LGQTWTQGGTVPSFTYHFRLSVQNAQGWSEWSQVTAILAANMPAQTEMPTVEQVSAASTFVKIDWNAPDERGSTITKYEIILLSSDGSFYSVEEMCDGTDSTVVSETSCTFDML
jgi:hypothetical protein